MLQKYIDYALRKIGFVGLGPMDWIYEEDGVVCAVPVEHTMTFEDAIQFLREGAFQRTLQKKTRLIYYRMSEELQTCHSNLLKGNNGPTKRTG